MAGPSGQASRRIERTLNRDARISSLRRSGLAVSSSCGGWRKLSSGSVRGGWVGSARPLVGWSGASAIFGAALITVKVQSGLGIRLCSMRRTAPLVYLDLVASVATCAGLGSLGVNGGLGLRHRSIWVGRTPACSQSRLSAQWGVVRGGRPLLWRRPGQIMRSDRAAG